MSFLAPIADGTLTGVTRSYSGSLAAPPLSEAAGESPESSAVAELGNLISSIGTLSAQAQNLPLSPPALPGLPQTPGYQPQATDYMQLVSDQS